MPNLAEWDSFYVIVGSAAGALIGLQFVVMTLIADSPSIPNPVAGAAFGSPTIVHFGMTLLLSAIVRVPWPNPHVLAWVLGGLGVLGVIYMAIVVHRVMSQNAYKPDLEDWTFHIIIPGLAYALLLASGVEEPMHGNAAMFGVGAAALMLLFDGIHNAWDTVAYQVYFARRNQQK